MKIGISSQQETETHNVVMNQTDKMIFNWINYVSRALGRYCFVFKKCVLKKILW
jgi:hypothetical protein